MFIFNISKSRRNSAAGTSKVSPMLIFDDAMGQGITSALN
jgi:hypothetical protein